MQDFFDFKILSPWRRGAVRAARLFATMIMASGLVTMAPVKAETTLTGAAAAQATPVADAVRGAPPDFSSHTSPTHTSTASQTQPLTQLAQWQAPQASTSARSAKAVEDAQGFTLHGVPTPQSQLRGVLASADGQGRDVVLAWLQDYRGGYAMLMIDAQTGQTAQVDTPFDPEGDEPFAVLLSSRNRVYTLFNHHFVEFDVATGQFTKAQKVDGKTAMGLTEDASGNIWAATYPNNDLLSYTPDTQALQSHGVLASESWEQYPRSVAADSQGWIYVGVGLAASQIYAFNVATGEKRTLLPASQRLKTAAEVIQSRANVVFGRNGDQHYMLSGGAISRLAKESPSAQSALMGGKQNYRATHFPSGRALVNLDLAARRLVTRDTAGTEQAVSFEYQTGGAALTTVCATASGRICGGSRFPMHVFSFDPATEQFQSREIPRQPNVIVPQGERLFVAGYPDGLLLRERADKPLHFDQLAKADAVINRPHALIFRDKGRQAVMAGTPGYGYTGGGMLFWRQGSKTHLLRDRNLVPQQSTQTMLPLADGKVLAGTTSAPGTGGQPGDSQGAAQLYLIDPSASADDKAKLMPWSGTPVPGASVITDLVQVGNDVVYGIADSRYLFALNIRTRKLLGTPFDFGQTLGYSVYSQGTRAFVTGTAAQAGEVAPVFVLLGDGIARLDTTNHTLQRVAQSPVPITAGGAWADGRVYFASNHQLYSWRAR